ncbi:Spore germination protein YndE [Paraliobacillus sp. PM-2]|uniref:GerAB/ArcD/ProY family transporter n=1 Tax=Paraliobacillus sp. PM-2 TaxID=1462524 RepID=UPI00061CA04A|nr:GerAB/ArcD/ProY family transporter [Paraliobacillus sp. PM-2]CQR45777.1 Spore germination protein YndE [Paraliobacillus sp. PM-2]
MNPHKLLKTGEMFAMLVILLSLKASDTTASLLAQHTQNAFWYMPFISLLVVLPSILILVHLLKKYEDKNLVQLIEAIMGSWASKVISFMIFLSSFILMGFSYRSYVGQIKIMYFPQTPTLFLYLIFFIIVYFAAKKGWEVIGFTSKIFLPLFIVSTLILISLTMNDIVIERIFPFFGSGKLPILKEGALKGSIFVEVFLITIAYTSFKKTNYFRKGLFLGLAFSTVKIMLFFFIYATLFDYNSIVMLSYPFHDVLQYVHFGALTNIETFFMIFWLLGSFLRYAIYLYLVSWIFSEIFHIKHIESLLLPIGFLGLMVAVISRNVIVSELVFYNSISNYITFFYIGFPILLWLVSSLKGEMIKQ